MGIPLGELAERMSALEFSLHMQQFQEQPWGPEREELNTAVVARSIARFAGRVCKETPPLSEFFTYGREEAEKHEASKHTIGPDVDPVEFARKLNG